MAKFEREASSFKHFCTILFVCMLMSAYIFSATVSIIDASSPLAGLKKNNVNLIKAQVSLKVEGY